MAAAGNFAEFGAETAGPRIAYQDEQEWRGNETLIQQRLGQIAMQPAALAHTQAQTRHLNAQSGVEEQKIEEAKKLAAIATQVGAGGDAAPGDLAGQLDRMGSFLIRGGMPVKGADFIGKAAQIRSRDAATEASEAAATANEARTMETRARRVGSIAMSAMASPEAYAQARLLGASEGFRFDALPPDFEQAKPMLQQLAAAGMSAADQAREAGRAADQKTKDAARTARVAAAGATIARSRAQTDLIRERLRLVKKDDGEGSASVAEYRRALAAESRVRTEAKKAGEEAGGAIPDAPRNPAMRRIGVPYKSPATGEAIVWDGKEWKKAPAAAPNALQRGLGAAASWLGIGEADDDEEEDDD